MLAEHELVKEAFETLRAAYTKSALSVHVNDDLGRFRFMEALRQVDLVESHLRAVINAGTIARNEIAQLNPPINLVERLKRRF